MAAANSSGGVMGKMIDAQSIVVASTATGWVGHEWRILRFVFWHCLALATLVGARAAAAVRVYVDGREVGGTGGQVDRRTGGQVDRSDERARSDGTFRQQRVGYSPSPAAVAAEGKASRLFLCKPFEGLLCLSRKENFPVQSVIRFLI